MHARLLNMLHHPANESSAFNARRTGIPDAIHIALNGVIQEAVQQHRRIVADLDRLAHVTLEVTLLVHDFHRAPAQHITGAHHQRVSKCSGLFQSLGLGTSGGVGRLAQAQ